MDAMRMAAAPDDLDRVIGKKIGHNEAWVMVRMPYTATNLDLESQAITFSLHGTPQSPAEFLMILEAIVAHIRHGFRLQGVDPDQALEALDKTMIEELGE